MTFYFYDLETSGRDPRMQRIMQFAGQRTDENLNLIGEPFVTCVRLSDDILPEPEAVLLTGITPQQANDEGITEPEFLRRFYEEVLQPDTCIMGYNTIRFDDEFMRFTLWRNFYDAYEWQWKDGKFRWDLIDVVRMTRALRPDGINWPVDDSGKPINKLTDLTSSNGLDHENAHDALSDVLATIDMAKLLKDKQPKLFEYMFSKCQKRDVAAMINPEKPQPFVHTSGMLPPEFINTSVMLPLFADKKQSTKIVAYDLRYDPEQFVDLSVDELRARLFTRRDELGDVQRLPLKAVHTNKAPAIAPLGVLDEATQQRIGISIETIELHRNKLLRLKDLMAKLYDAWHTDQREFDDNPDVDASLYGGSFLGDADKSTALEIRNADQTTLGNYNPSFQDNRLSELFFRYKARNFPSVLSEEEHIRWENYRREKLLIKGELQRYGETLQKLIQEQPGKREAALIEDLKLYAESIIPTDEN